jgi:hypothetical protein
MLLESSLTLLDNIHSTGVTHDDHHGAVVAAKLGEGEIELGGWPPGSKAGRGGKEVSLVRGKKKKVRWNPPCRWLLTGG